MVIIFPQLRRVKSFNTVTWPVLDPLNGKENCVLSGAFLGETIVIMTSNINYNWINMEYKHALDLKVVEKNSDYVGFRKKLDKWMFLQTTICLGVGPNVGVFRLMFL